MNISIIIAKSDLLTKTHTQIKGGHNLSPLSYHLVSFKFWERYSYKVSM